jgi:DNA gyrase subunit A
MSVADIRVMGRATQGVRLINLTKKNDVIASVCKVMSSELEETVEEESRAQWVKKSEEIKQDSHADISSGEVSSEAENDENSSDKE